MVKREKQLMGWHCEMKTTRCLLKLKKRFGIVQEIVNAHYSHFVNLQTASNRVSSLGDLHDTVERNLRSLEVLKQNLKQDVLVSIIKSKLHEDVVLQLEV